MKYTDNKFGLILFFFILLFLYTKFIGPIPFSVTSVQTTKSNFFAVSGNGEAAGIPNTALLSIGITKTASTVYTAQTQVNAPMNKTIDELKKLGVNEKNIKTTDYSVSPDYDYSAGKQTVRGYTVTQSLQVKISPIEKANSAIDIASSNGLNLINGVTFVLDEKTMDKIQQEAQKNAISEAKKKAENLAGLAGIKLGRIVNIEQSNGTLDRFGPVTLEAQKTNQTQLTPGENKVSITVTISYETN